MKKLNLGNITAGLDTIKKLAEENSTIARDEVVDVMLIDCAEKNTYAADDTDETIKDLADQIASVGLLNPLGVIKDGARYKLFSGERRYKAITKLLHWTTVPCRVFEGVSTGRAQLMLHIANKQRNLSASRQLEIFEEYYKLLKELEQNGEVTGNLVQTIAKEMEISERQVRKYRAISERLTDEERGLLSAGTLTVNEASRIATMRASENKTETVAPITKAKTDEIAEPSSASAPERETSVNPEPSSAPVTPASEPKTEVKPEPGSAPELRKSTNAEPSSASGQIIVTDEDTRKEFLRTVILSEQVWSLKKILDFYVETMPTPQEAIKQFLKPRYGYASGTIRINGDVGHCTRENGKMIICMHTKRIQTIVYKYSEVDAIIRELYREGLLEDDTEDEESAEYLDMEEDLISEDLV